MIPPEFHLLRPQWLLALLPLVFGLWLVRRGASGGDTWRRVVDAHLLPHLLVDDRTHRRALPLSLLAFGGLLAVAGLAGPAWERLPQPVFEVVMYRVLVLDISESMNATDIAPSRIGRARFETLDLLRQAREGHTAMIAFAGEPFVVSPLTADTETIAMQVPHLSSEVLESDLLRDARVRQAQRTDLAIAAAQELLTQAGAREGSVILITDGIEDPAATLQQARAARDAGFTVSVLAISETEQEGLRAVARMGAGVYTTMSIDDQDVQALLAGESAERTTHTAESDDVQADVWRDQGIWLLLAALPIAALAFRRGWLSPAVVLLCVLAAPRADALDWSHLWSRADQRAAQLYSQGEPAAAARTFERADWRAAAAYEAGEFESAVQALASETGVTADYNRGNALAKLGRIDAAIAAYERALETDPDHADARYNRDLLQRLQQQQEQQQQQQDQQQAADQEQRSGAEQSQSAAQQAQDNQTSDESEPQSNEASESQSAQEDQGQQARGDDGEPQQARAPDAGDLTGTRDEQQEGPAQSSDSEPRGLQSPQDLQAQLEQQRAEQESEQLARAAEDLFEREALQALEQKLRRVPDDPAGLLRQRFLLQYLRRHGEL